MPPIKDILLGKANEMWQYITIRCFKNASPRLKKKFYYLRQISADEHIVVMIILAYQEEFGNKPSLDDDITGLLKRLASKSERYKSNSLTEAFEKIVDVQISKTQKRIANQNASNQIKPDGWDEIVHLINQLEQTQS